MKCLEEKPHNPARFGAKDYCPYHDYKGHQTFQCRFSASIWKILSSKDIFGNTTLIPELPPRQKDNRRPYLWLDHNTWSLSTERLTNTNPTNKNRKVPPMDNTPCISLQFSCILLKLFNKNTFLLLMDSLQPSQDLWNLLISLHSASLWAILSEVLWLHVWEGLPHSRSITATSDSWLPTPFAGSTNPLISPKRPTHERLFPETSTCLFHGGKPPSRRNYYKHLTLEPLWLLHNQATASQTP